MGRGREGQTSLVNLNRAGTVQPNDSTIQALSGKEVRLKKQKSKRNWAEGGSQNGIPLPLKIRPGGGETGTECMLKGSNL